MYEIERGNPPPKSRKYPWREMQVGDSFFVEATDHKEITRVRNILGSVARANVRAGNLPAGYRVTCRAVRDGDRFLGVRCWRIQ